MDYRDDKLFAKLMGLGKPTQWVVAAILALGRQDDLVKRIVFLGDSAFVVMLVDKLLAREGACRPAGGNGGEAAGGGVATATGGRINGYVQLLRDIGEPSKLQPSKLQDVPLAEGGPLIDNWRPFDTAAGLPPALQHPAFGRFLDIANSGQADEQDMVAACSLCGAATPYHKSEEGLLKYVVPVLREYLDVRRDQEDLVPFSNWHGEGGVKPDWHVVDDSEDVTCLLALLVAKNGFKDCDPAYQGAACYSRFWASRLGGVDNVRLRELFNGTCCPALLVEVIGPHLRVSALSWLGRVTVCPLTPLLNLLWLEGDPQTCTLACTLRALKDALGLLSGFYRDARIAGIQNRKPGVDLGQPYPLHELYRDSQPLVQGSRLLYDAVRPADNKRVVVKFARSYGVEVHRTWASRGLAPQLFLHQVLPGGFHLVEMELMNEEDGWLPLVAVTDATEAAAAAEAALRALADAHGSSSPACVHGDARRANCLVRTQPMPGSSGVSGGGGWEVRFVDFEFSGVEGEHVYPAPLNPNISWAEGAAYGRPLQASHDVHLLRQRDGGVPARMRELQGWGVVPDKRRWEG